MRRCYLCVQKVIISFSISYAPNARNHFSAIATTRKKVLLIARLIIINFSATYVLSVIKSLQEMVIVYWLITLTYPNFNILQFLRLWIKLGASTISRVLFVTKKWIRKLNSTNLIWNQFARNATRSSPMNYGVDYDDSMKLLLRKWPLKPKYQVFFLPPSLPCADFYIMVLRILRHGYIKILVVLLTTFILHYNNLLLLYLTVVYY